MRSHEESNLQKNCVKWFSDTYPQLNDVFFAVPNGGARSVITGAILKAEGVKRGIADLLLLVPTRHYHGLCIEMKTAKGRQSIAQKHWQKAVTAQGYKYVICRNGRDFAMAIINYLSGQK